PLPLLLALAVGLLLPGAGLAAGPSLQRLEAARVQGEVERYVARELAATGDRWRVGRVRIFGDTSFPAGPLRLSLSRGRGVALAGTVVLHLRVEDGGGHVRRLRVAVPIERRCRVWVAARDLPRGTLLVPELLQASFRPWGRVARDRLADPAAAQGMELRRSLRAGDVVRLADLRRHPVVHRGDRVTLVARRGPLEVTTFGIVRQEAGLHDRVRVANAASGKVVTGEVVDPHTVEVSF
ncbi:MAG: flagella basal body P-ring formation protein FlgA, partial [Nitrospirae bacterium]